jgi:hypothetical protein
MKKLIIAGLIASLGLNAALLAFFVKGRSEAENNAKQIKEAIAAESALPSVQTPEATAELWAQLSSAELPVLVQRLREAGFPPHVIRAIVSGQLGSAYLAKRRQLDPEGETRPFWREGNRRPEANVELRKLGKEHRQLMRDLLGEEDDAPYRSANYEARVAFLPPEKATAALKIIREFDDKRQDIFAAGYMPAADREKLNAVTKAQHDALAALLTPQELEEYDLRFSNVADNLRYQLLAFDTNEAEFRTIFRIQQTYTDRAGGSFYSPGGNQEQMRQRRELQKQMNDEIVAALGKERGEDYTKAIDYSYRQTSQIVARLELPADTTDKVWDVQKITQQQYESLRSDKSLSKDERKARQTELVQKAEAQLTSLLGAKGVSVYRDYGGFWLRNLQPQK